MRMDKLEQSITASNHIHIVAVANPLEENLENPQASLTQNGARPDHDQPRTPSGADLADRLFASQLGAAIDLCRAQRRGFGNGTRLRDAKDSGRAHVHESFDTDAGSLLGGDPAAFDVHLPELRAGFRQRNQRGIMVNYGNIAQCALDTLPIANVAPNK